MARVVNGIKIPKHLEHLPEKVLINLMYLFRSIV